VSVRSATANGRPEKTALLVARRIVGDIRRNGHVAGDRLPAEVSMIEKYQVGRGTLRESLRFLELQGVIALKPGPGGGPVVQKPDASNLATTLLLMLQFEDAQFASVLEVRRTMDPLMARLAASRMEPDRLKELEQSVELMRTSLDDLEVFLVANRTFHQAIAWASGNPVYGLVLDALLDIADGTKVGVSYPAPRRAGILKAHTAIYDAIARHDGDASEEAMARHMDEYIKYVTHKFPEVLTESVSWDTVG
jgi:DNA-binding FadR family transcriptional regulator